MSHMFGYLLSGEFFEVYLNDSIRCVETKERRLKPQFCALFDARNLLARTSNCYFPIQLFYF